MKPDSTPPGVPFNFDAIPLWIKPDLWDEAKVVRCRGLLFVVLYTLSGAAFGAFLAIPIGIHKGMCAIGTTTIIWLALSLPGGILLGLGAWWDFVRGSRRIAAEEVSRAQAEKISNSPEIHKQ